MAICSRVVHLPESQLLSVIFVLRVVPLPESQLLPVALCFKGCPSAWISTAISSSLFQGLSLRLNHFRNLYWCFCAKAVDSAHPRGLLLCTLALEYIGYLVRRDVGIRNFLELSGLSWLHFHTHSLWPEYALFSHRKRSSIKCTIVLEVLNFARFVDLRTATPCASRWVYYATAEPDFKEFVKFWLTFRADLEIIERSLQRLLIISYKDYLATEAVHCKIILVATEEHAVSMQKLIGMAI